MKSRVSPAQGATVPAAAGAARAADSGARPPAARALESAALAAPAAAGTVAPWAGETRLFITPGYRFQVSDVLMTNFHLPESSLLMLVCAFAGTRAVLAAYAHAVRARYRFFSYGDAMLLTRGDG